MNRDMSGRGRKLRKNPSLTFTRIVMDLVHASERAASAVPSVRQSGEDELRTLESKQGFHAALLSVYSDESFPNSSRSLAVIYLKNAVERKWKRNDTFSQQEKDAIRDQVSASILLPATTSSKQSSKQLAVIIATMARSDFPRAWPNSLTALNQMVIDAANQNKKAELNSALETMHQTLKKLSTARIGQARVLLNEFSVTTVELYWRIFTSSGPYQALKIVGTSSYAGHDRAHRFEGPRAVFHELLPALQASNHVVRIGKIYERLSDRHPLVFCGFGADSAAVAKFYCDFLNGRPTSGPIVQAMVIIRDLTRVFKSHDLQETSLPLNLRPRDDQDRQDSKSAYEMCQTVFDAPQIIKLTDTLIQFFFQITEDDIELWRDDPAEFVIEEARQNPEYSVVLCAEMLFAHLLKAWPETVAPQAQMLIQSAVESGHDQSVEAALRASQFGAATFSKSFDVEPIIRLLGPNSSPLVRRRLCLVASGWIPVRSDDAALQQLSFELVKSTSVDPQWDIVVQLGALDLAKVCCDDIDFNPENFNIAADAVFSSIYRSLQQPAQSPEVKLHVSQVLGTVIEGVGKRSSDVDVNKILEILPASWDAELEHSNHHLIQGAVSQTLAHSVSAQGSLNRRSYEVSIPLCQIATDPSQPISQYLLDDALNLWKALLSNASSQESAALGPLFERLVVLIETRTEYLAVSSTILESFLWLDYQIAMPYSDKLLSLCSLYLSDGIALDEASSISLGVETLSITSFHSDNSTSVILAMKRSGLESWIESQIALAGKSDADLTMDVLIQASKCLNVVSFVASKSNGQAIENPDAIFPAWLSRIRGVSDPRDRKLVSMGVTAILLSYPQELDAWAEEYVRQIGMTLEEIPDTAPLNIYVQNLAEDEHSTEEEKRKQAQRMMEVPINMGLQAYVSQVAHDLQQRGYSKMLEFCIHMGVLPN